MKFPWSVEKSKSDSRHDELGFEKGNPTPVHIPVGFQRPPTLAEQVARLIRSSDVRKYAESQGLESFEDADNFDIDDANDPSSPWEEHFDMATHRGIEYGVTQNPAFDERYIGAKTRSKGIRERLSKKPAPTPPPGEQKA